jgi:hypothetical protein
MCAHAATIFVRVLSVADPVAFLKDAKACLGAPGIDCTLGFKFEYGWDYSALYDACHDGDARKAREVMTAMLNVINPVLMHYGSMEEFVRVKMEYWKPNTAWNKMRYTKFHSVEFDHAAVGGGAPYTDKGQSRYLAIAAGNA